MSSTPLRVARHLVMSPSAEGKAEMPGAGEVMSCISSVWSLFVWDSIRSLVFLSAKDAGEKKKSCCVVSMSVLTSW